MSGRSRGSCRRDRFTIAWLIGYTVAVAVTFAVCVAWEFTLDDVRDCRWFAICLLLGSSCYGALIVLYRQWQGIRPRAGGFLLLLPTVGMLMAVAKPVYRSLIHSDVGDSDPLVILVFILPMAMLLLLLAAFIGRIVDRRRFGPAHRWSERFGLWLALGWSVMGAWTIVDVYLITFR